MPYGILDRAAAELITALPANVGRVQTDAFDVSRPEHLTYRGEARPRWLRHVGGAFYYECDTPPANVAWLTNSDGTKRPNPAFLHFPNDANAHGGVATPENPLGGSWFMLEPTMGENDLYQYGGIRGEWNDFDTGAVANWRAINDYKNFRASEWYHPNTVLFIPSGGFAVDKPVIVKEGTIHLTGKREGRDGAKSCLFFRDTDESFIIHYDNTGGDRVIQQRHEFGDGSDRRSGSFTILRGFGIFNQASITKDYRAVADMILLRARATIDHMWLSGAPRHAINIVTSINAANEHPGGNWPDFAAGNANSARLTYNSIQWAGGSGIRCIGSDSNNVLLLHNEENFCGQSGVLEESFLGPNPSIANHTTDNAIGVGSTYAHGYKHDTRVDFQTKPGCYVWVKGEDGVKEVYIARMPYQYQENSRRWQELVDTKPGTNEDIWAFYARDTNPGINTPTWFSKEWLPDQPIGTYTWAGPRLYAGVQNYSGSIFCYDEGSQPPNQIQTPRGTHRGNASGGFILNGASGDIFDEGVDYGQRTFRAKHYDNEEKRWKSFDVNLAYNENGILWADKVSSSEGFQFGRALEGGDLVFRTGLQPSQRTGAIIGSSSIAKDGSGRGFERGTHVFGRMAVATTYSYKAWEGTRIARRRATQIGDGNSMFEGLGVGDVVIDVKDNIPSDPYNALVPGGYGANVIVEAPDPRAAKKYLPFGKLGDTVLGSVPEVEPPPPPPPPPPPDTPASVLFNRVDPSLVTEDVAQGGKATKVANFGAHAKAMAVKPAGNGVRDFEVIVGHVGDIAIGFASAQEPLDGSLIGANPATSSGLWNNGWTQHNNGSWVQAQGFVEGQRVRCTFNTATKDATWEVDGVVVLIRTLAIEGDVFPAVSLRYEGDTVTVSLTPAGLQNGVLAWDA